MGAKKDSREKILEAATQLFHLQGYHATGLNQILKESGAPKGSLYYHFPNGKEQLAIEAVNSMAVLIQNDIRSRLAEHDNALAGLQSHIRFIADHFNDTEHLKGVPIGLLAAETSLISEPLRKASKAAFEGWEALYREKLIEDGFEEESAHRLSMIINAMIEGAITRSLTEKNGVPLLYVVDCLPDLLKK
ncbi:MAG: TetR/AcrR family transcriptional regulator [Bacillus sp. (in: firmicutes)]